MKITFSKHAASAMQARRVSELEVSRVLQDYELKHDASRYRKKTRPGTYVFKRGPLAVVANERGLNWWHVITVLLNKPVQWTDHDARSRVG